MHPAQQIALFRPELHLVRVTVPEDGSQKRPRDRAWQRRQPSPQAVAEHVAEGGALGYIPGSLGALVLDVDTGPDTSADVLAFAGPPAAVTTSWRARGHHLCYLAPADWSDPADRGRGAFRIGEAAGEWIHRRSFSLETREGWEVLADIDLTGPELDGALLDTIVQPCAPPPTRTETRAGAPLHRADLQGDGPLGRGRRWLGLRYRLHRDAARMAREGVCTAVAIEERAWQLNRAHCRPWLAARELNRLARDTADYWAQRLAHGDDPAWLRRQAARSARGVGARRANRDRRLDEARKLYSAGLTPPDVARAIGVSRRTAERYRARLACN